MSEKFLTTSEVSNLLKINEKKVYSLAKNGIIPGTKVTGKWIFPENKLKEYLTLKAIENIKGGIPDVLIKNNILIGAGSDDPMLSKVFGNFFKKTGINIFYTTVGSQKGIELLKIKISHFALSHLFDSATATFNISYLKEKTSGNDYIVLNLFKREIGIISKNKLRSLEELNKREFVFVLRQKGSGTRNYTDYLFSQNIIKKSSIKFHDEEVFSHFDLAQMVKNNPNFIGIGTHSSAKIFDLQFFKLLDENFDLITSKEFFFSKVFQKLYEFIREDISHCVRISGYDFSLSGRILYPY